MIPNSENAAAPSKVIYGAKHPADQAQSRRSRVLLWAARLSLPALVAAMGFVITPPASAVPSFAQQTGQPCQACHVGGFGPELTPFGREFKLGGYTLRTQASVPVAAMIVASVTHTRKGQDPAGLPNGFSANDNIAFDQGSAFLAGGIGQHFGGFAQVTYDGVNNQWHWDNLDLRAVTTGHLFGQDAVFGLTVNNSPTVQDAWNTTPAWGFPYTASALAPTPDAAPLIDSALAQNVLGMSAYGWIGHQFYLEAGAYGTPAAGTLNWLGTDPNGGPAGSIRGLAPYGRLTWQHGLAGGTAEVGTFVLLAHMDPIRINASGYTDHYADVGADASWQKALASGNTISANLRYIHESANYLASCGMGLSPTNDPNCANVTLNEWRGVVAYSWHNKIGASLGAFSIAGTSNSLLYAGNRTYSPNSNGVTGQLDYTPWSAGNSPLGMRANMRLGLQYTAYGKFNGAWHNYDGANTNTANNNTLRFFTWLAF